MAKLLFRLRHVPDDEADEIRQLLEDHHFDTYETEAGNWGISMPAIWLREEERFDEACRLLEQYHRERAQRVRAEYETLLTDGEQPSVFSLLRNQPLRVVFYSVLTGLFLYLCISSFFRF